MSYLEYLNPLSYFNLNELNETHPPIINQDNNNKIELLTNEIPINSRTAIQLNSINKKKINIHKIACGQDYIVLLMQDGTLYVQGDNQFGQLGTGDNKNRIKFTKLNITNVVDVVCGANHTIILLDNGRVMSCGSNKFGQLGINDRSYINEFTDLYTLKDSEGYEFELIFNVIQIACFENTTFILRQNNTLFATGDNSFGQLGLGDYVNRKIFTQVNLDTNVQIKKIACGNKHTFILMKDSTVYCCGYNDFIDHPEVRKYTSQNTFIKHVFKNVININCGHSSSFITTNDNITRVCGDNINGQLGIGECENFENNNNNIFDNFYVLDSTNVINYISAYNSTYKFGKYNSAVCGSNKNYKLGIVQDNLSYFEKINNFKLNISQIACTEKQTLLLVKNYGKYKNDVIFICGHNLKYNLCKDVNRLHLFTLVTLDNFDD
jgi:alpha-tubulin suppressor-like RCC1 family protein